MAETEGDARPPPDLADPDRPPPHAGRGMEPRVGGRVRGTRPPRETDVHRVQGLQLRRGEPAPPRGEQRPQSRVNPDLRRTPGRAAGLQDRRRARRQSGRPAHPGRRTPSSFPLNGLTAAVFRAPAGYAGLYLLLSIPLMSDTIPIYVYSLFNQEGKALERNMFLIANFLAALNRVAILGAIWFVAREFFPI